MKLKDLIGKIAPTLATALGGPLAGAAVREIAAKVLGKPDMPQDEVEKALESGLDKDTIVKLRELDNAFKTEMAKAGIDLEKIEAEDRANARQRQVSLRDPTNAILAGAIIVIFASMQFYLLGHEPPIGSRDAIMRAMGILDAAIVMVLSYYFGSSKGSREKDQVLGRVAESA